MLQSTTERLKDTQAKVVELKAQRALLIEGYNYLLKATKQEIERHGESSEVWCKAKGVKPFEMADMNANVIDLLTEYIIDNEEDENS